MADGTLADDREQQFMSGDGLVRLVPWGAFLLAALVVFAIIVWLVRRRFLGSQRSGDPAGWTLDELDRMHTKGLLSDREYQRLRRSSIASWTQDD